MTTVSAILPTHNRAGLIERAVRSVLAQTRPPDEVIVVDDGSSDGTADRLRARFPRIRCLSQPHSGVSAARNQGMQEAGGDWLAFLDSDDEWHPEKLAVQLDAIGSTHPPEPPGDLGGRPHDGFRICHTDEIWIRNGRRVNPRLRNAKRGGYIFEHCLPLCAISPSSVIVHRDVFEEVGLFDEDLPACEDYDLWLRICASYPVLYVDRQLTVKYGGHDDQLSRTVPALDRFRIRALTKVLDSGPLRRTDREAAAEMLLQKIQIYRQGVIKRGRLAEAAELDALELRVLET